MTFQNQDIAVETPRKFRIATDCYIRRFIKYPRVAICHSYSELLYLALLEGDPRVSSFTPQPQLLKINGRRYTPDSFYVKDGERTYVELKPRGEFRDELKRPMEAYAKRNNCKFKVVANEEVLEQITKAKNWLHIIGVLLSSTSEDTSGAEQDMLERLHYEQSTTIRDVMDQYDRIGNRLNEIALFRLAHQGLASLDLDNSPLSYDTRVVSRK